jgi:hypothetical protein
MELRMIDRRISSSESVSMMQLLLDLSKLQVDPELRIGH